MATAMIAGVVAPVATAAEEKKSFPDVPANHWGLESINYLVEKGAINGKPDGTFAPSEEMDRASVAKVVAIALGLEIQEDAKPSFEDAKDHWAAKYIAAVEKAGVITGDGTGNFNPNGKMNRASIASMLVKAYKLDTKVTGTPETKFADLKGHWGKDYANILVELNISNGTGDNWNPDGTASRAEVAKFVAQTDMKYGKEEVKEAKVESVTSLNAKQVEVKFTQPVDVQTVVDADGALKSTVVLSSVGDAKAIDLKKAKASLSEDGKTLVITAGGEEVFSGKYAATIIGVKTLDGKELPSYAGFIVAEDTTRPVVTGVQYVDNNTAKVMFSEPLAEIGTVTTDNESVTAAEVKFNKGDNFVTVDLSKVAGEGTTNVNMTIVGAKDFAGNFISPNPVKVAVEKKEDKVAPEVKAVQVVSDTELKVTYSEKIKTATVKVNGAEVTGTPDAEGLVYTFTTNLKDGVNKVEITNVTDLVGNEGKEYSKQIVVSTDKVAPTVVSEKVVKEDGKEVLVLTFSEEVVLGTTGEQTFSGTFVKDFVTASGTFKATPVVDSKDAKTVKIPLAEAAAGKWTLNMPKGFVTDKAQAKNAFEAKEIKFERGADDVATEKVTVDVSEEKNVITVKYNGKVDGASATNVANYKLEGAAIEKAVLKSNETNGAVVELTVKSESVKAKGEYQLTVAGVKAHAGTAIESVTKAVQLDENVLPVMQKVELVNGTDIVITFSENVAATSVVEKDGENKPAPVVDYNVFVGGVQVDEAKVKESMGTNKNEIKLTLTDALTSEQLTKAITIKPATNFEVTDEVGNKAVKFEEFTVVNAIK